MPKIVITERDTTGTVQQSSISNIVYVPIRAQALVGDTENAPRYTDIFDCRSVSQLEDAFPNGEADNLDFKICKHLINLGFEVLVQGWITAGTNTTNTKGYTSCVGTCATGWKKMTVEKPTGGWPDLADLNTVFGALDSPVLSNDWTPVGENGEDEWIVEEDNPAVTYRYGIANFTENIAASFENKDTAHTEDPYIDETEVTTVQYAFDQNIPTNGSETDVYACENEGGHPAVSVVSGSTPTFTYYYAGNVKPEDSQSAATLYCVSNANAYMYTNGKFLKQATTFAVREGPDASGWKVLEDKGLYDVRFLTHGLFKFSSTMVSTAANRGDCVALLNADEGKAGFSYDVADVREAFSAVVQSGGEYAAGFTPWFYSLNEDLVGETEVKDDQRVLVPAAYGYLFAYANSIRNNPEWYAVAGFQRGVIPELNGVAYNYTTADVEVLQARGANEEVPLDDDADNVGFAINPIAYIRPAGYIIWGNRTLLINDAVKKTIATSFLNVRNGVSAIKKVLYTAARKYTFEQNNEILWVNFQAYTKPLLDRMQSGNGLLGYKWIRRPTTAKARLSATLKIVPIEAVEDFELEVYLTDDLEVSE